MRYEDPENYSGSFFNAKQALEKEDEQIIDALFIAMHAVRKLHIISNFQREQSPALLDTQGICAEIEEALETGERIDSIIRALKRWKAYRSKQIREWDYLL